MYFILNAKQMIKLEEEAIKNRNLTINKLMERAGKALADEAVKLKPNGLIAVVCGRGNNAGDGFIAAQYLNEQNYEVKVVSLYEKENLSKEAKEAYLSTPKNIFVKKEEQVQVIENAEIIIDAIFGFSFRPPVRDYELGFIKIINDNLKGYVISADVPSAIEATTGIGQEGEVVKADKTVCFTGIKEGLINANGPNYAKEIVVADIGINKEITKKYMSAQAISIDDAFSMLPKRSVLSHKKSVGKVLIISGSTDYTGAPALTALAAYRAGAGYVTLVVPKSIKAVVQEKVSPEVIVKGIGAKDEQCFNSSMASELLEIAHDYDCVAIGPGISRDAETLKFIKDFLREVKKPTIVDADALIAIANDKKILKEKKAEFILTPHSGELSELIGLNVEDIEKDRLKSVSELADKKTIVLLKGFYSLISSGREENIFVNLTSNPGMATAGTGDVLTGIIASLVAQGLKAETAAVLGAYLHGLAGDIAAHEMSEYSIIATDIIKYISKAYKKIMKGID